MLGPARAASHFEVTEVCVSRLKFYPVLLLIVLTACSTGTATDQQASTPTQSQKPTRTPPPTATVYVTPTSEQLPEGAFDGLPLPQDSGDYFSSSGTCALCHNNMMDESGTDVSITMYWRSTILANAARDPYWQASLAHEILENPEIESSTQDVCTKCHMPMARFTANEDGEEVIAVGDGGFLSEDHPLHNLAMDGVSCALCHQIREDGLGSSTTNGGDFYIDSELRKPDRLIFGPFTIDDFQADLMQNSVGFRPEQGLHLSNSTFCATCHTLYTTYVDASGQLAGEFPEQVPYYEWFYSDYRRTRACQDCHMPEAEGGVKIANTSDVLRSPISTHAFVGGNAYMLEMLSSYSDELAVTASSEHFDATIARTRDLLQNETATIDFEELRLSGVYLTADLWIENLAGHKFPTAFPARRVWIHFTVRDVDGEIVFESGAWNPDGSIVGNANDVDATTFEQHYDAIVQPEQVQIYEAILQDSENRVTTVLLEAASYRKDNRLLPSGFEKQAPYQDIAVRGEAKEDDDFEGGGDEIQYVIDLTDHQGPFTVTVELLYQSVGYRWANNLGVYSHPLIDRFIGYYNAVPNIPVVIASVTSEIE
jgi:hypothetical protein